MNDRPTAVELVNAVRQYLESELLPTLTDARLKFQTLIAANVLSIAEREWQHEETDLSDELASYGELLELGDKPSTLENCERRRGRRMSGCANRFGAASTINRRDSRRWQATCGDSSNANYRWRTRATSRP